MSSVSDRDLLRFVYSNPGKHGDEIVRKFKDNGVGDTLNDLIGRKFLSVEYGRLIITKKGFKFLKRGGVL